MSSKWFGDPLSSGSPVVLGASVLTRTQFPPVARADVRHEVTALFDPHAVSFASLDRRILSSDAPRLRKSYEARSPYRETPRGNGNFAKNFFGYRLYLLVQRKLRLFCSQIKCHAMPDEITVFLQQTYLIRSWELPWVQGRKVIRRSGLSRKRLGASNDECVERRFIISSGYCKCCTRPGHLQGVSRYARRPLMRAARSGVTHLVVDEVVYLLERPAVEAGGEGLELARQHGAVLDAELAARLEAVLAHQLHRLALEPVQRLLGEGLHLRLDGRPPALRRRPAAHGRTTHSLAPALRPRRALLLVQRACVALHSAARARLDAACRARRRARHRRGARAPRMRARRVSTPQVWQTSSGSLLRCIPAYPLQLRLHAWCIHKQYPSSIPICNNLVVIDMTIEEARGENRLVLSISQGNAHLSVQPQHSGSEEAHHYAGRSYDDTTPLFDTETVLKTPFRCRVVAVKVLYMNTTLNAPVEMRIFAFCMRNSKAAESAPSSLCIEQVRDLEKLPIVSAIEHMYQSSLPSAFICKKKIDQAGGAIVGQRQKYLCCVRPSVILLEKRVVELYQRRERTWSHRAVKVPPIATQVGCGNRRKWHPTPIHFSLGLVCRSTTQRGSRRRPGRLQTRIQRSSESRQNRDLSPDTTRHQSASRASTILFQDKLCSKTLQFGTTFVIGSFELLLVLHVCPRTTNGQYRRNLILTLFKQRQEANSQRKERKADEGLSEEERGGSTWDNIFLGKPIGTLKNAGFKDDAQKKQSSASSVLHCGLILGVGDEARPDFCRENYCHIIVPNDSTGWRVFSAISRFSRPFILALLHSRLNHLHRLSRPRYGPTVVGRYVPSPGYCVTATTGVSTGATHARLGTCQGSEQAMAAFGHDGGSLGRPYRVRSGVCPVVYYAFVMNMEHRRNGGAGETGYPRENPPTNGIVRHDSHLRKSGDPDRLGDAAAQTHSMTLALPYWIIAPGIPARNESRWVCCIPSTYHWAIKVPRTPTDQLSYCRLWHPIPYCLPLGKCATRYTTVNGAVSVAELLTAYLTSAVIADSPPQGVGKLTSVVDRFTIETLRAWCPSYRSFRLVIDLIRPELVLHVRIPSLGQLRKAKSLASPRHYSPLCTLAWCHFVFLVLMWLRLHTGVYDCWSVLAALLSVVWSNENAPTWDMPALILNIWFLLWAVRVAKEGRGFGEASLRAILTCDEASTPGAAPQDCEGRSGAGGFSGMPVCGRRRDGKGLDDVRPAGKTDSNPGSSLLLPTPWIANRQATQASLPGMRGDASR
ncbi:hypothetical protein PR048_014461 [Dryococelus australis]|uniref:Uncharacterized protein n=1 Tax=Dryococelus australis TaxID=614101 RepID=A0ABQ9HEF6_9NEOP|nr:hypothetical protein PR048_014461 [Dryococelus australis]